jgi:hypothetical protein
MGRSHAFGLQYLSRAPALDKIICQFSLRPAYGSEQPKQGRNDLFHPHLPSPPIFTISFRLLLLFQNRYFLMKKPLS